MRFDYTHGKKAKYIVSIYAWNLNDLCYFGDYRSAKKFFQSVISKPHEVGTSVSIYDMANDVKKDFYKF